MDRDGAGVNIQDNYLGRACRERAWLNVLLNGGKRLTGRIRSFDRYALILEDRGVEQMVFKHAIATITISRTFNNTIRLGDAKEKKGAGGQKAAAREGRPAAGSEQPGGRKDTPSAAKPQPDGGGN